MQLSDRGEIKLKPTWKRELGQLSWYSDQDTGRTTEDLWPDSWKGPDISCCQKYAGRIRGPPNNLPGGYRQGG